MVFSVANSFLRAISGYFFFLVLILFCNNLHAQKRNNVWAFGDSVGLNFNTNPVSVFKSGSKGLKPPYYISSICDKEGNLMFYTDGITVWNRNNRILPVYNKYWPWFENVIPLITPYVGNDSLYYIFGVESDGLDRPNPNSHKLIYFSTKMYKSGDIEEVVYPRPSNKLFPAILLTDASRVLAGTGHCNQVDTWIIGHSPGAFFSFLITKNGVDPVPVISSVPSSVLPLKKLNVDISNLKISANSERMALPDNDNNKIVVFDFDNQTGKFSNPLVFSITDKETIEDVELSADGKKLYYGSFITEEDDIGAKVHFLYQLDLDAGPPDEIKKTLYRVNGRGDRTPCIRSCYMIQRTMQLGPDGKIYVNRRESDIGIDKNIGVIEDPSAIGKNVQYYASKIDLKRMPKYINYNYIRSASFTLKENSIQYNKNTCFDQPVQFNPIYNRLDSIKWDFGDSQSGNLNLSSQKNPSHKYPGPGTYIVHAVIYDRCLADTATATVFINKEASVHVPASIKDTLLCAGEKLTFDATAPFIKKYIWDDGYNKAKRDIDKAGSYTVTVYNDCSFESKTFNVTFKMCPCKPYIPNAFTPNYDGLNDVFRPVIECVPKEYQFQIYDRYGGIIFKSDKLNEGWNGNKGQTPLSAGIYVWILNYRHPGTRKFISKKGTVTLLR